MFKQKRNKRGWTLAVVLLTGLLGMWVVSASSVHKFQDAKQEASVGAISPLPTVLLSPSSVALSSPTPTLTIPLTGTTIERNRSGMYPKNNLTPGDILENATAEQICTPGYATSVRDVSTSVKQQVYAEYGLAYPQAAGAYEVDHFISLELGGSNSIKNLWPEPAEPKPGFHEKDIVENYLHEQVCQGDLSLPEAQNEIKTDWYKVYQQIPGRNSIENSVSVPTQPTAQINTSNVTQNNGATALCNDGTYSYATHHQGACSQHGGVKEFYR